MKDKQSAKGAGIINRTTLVFIFAFGLLTALHAQTAKRLTIGDPAPPLKVEAWVKGTPLTLEKGKVYVVEFWATWCGPCIQAMPHLSDLADKMKGKVEFVSVNVSDRSPEWESRPGSQAHIDRITKWVKDNADKMRYNVALDDAANTMSKTWLSAAVQNGIPCAFVIDQEGTIAWIGQPEMGIDNAVVQVYEKKFDKASYKKQYEAYNKPFFEIQAKQDALISVAKTGDLKAIEKAYKKSVTDPIHPDFRAVTTILDHLSRKNPEAAVAFLQKRSIDDFKNDFETIGSEAAFIATNIKGNKKATKSLAELSLKNANKVKPEARAIIYAYHARVLFFTGDKVGAYKWLNQADSKLSVYEPAQFRDNIKKYIDDTRLKFDKADGQ